MTPDKKSCAVALPRKRNSATFTQSGATPPATAPQQTSIKALATRVLGRNQQRNHTATDTETDRNFYPQNHPQKLRYCDGCNQGAVSSLPSWLPTGYTAHDEQQPADGLPGTSKADEATVAQRTYFAAAWPWIKEHEAALLAAGWTMPELVRRSRYRWPMGPWGLAWLPVWCKPGVVVTLGSKGEIVFTWRDGERIIKQTARLG